MGVLKVTLRPQGCSASCVFCDQSVEQGTDAWSDLRAFLEAQARHATALHLTGHDSVASPHLLRVLRWAANRAMPVTLSTPGHLLQKPGLAQRLADEGLTQLRVSLHGGRKATHEAITRVAGSWVGSLTAIREACKVKGLSVWVQTTACEENADELPHIQHLVAMAGAERIRFRMLHGPTGGLTPLQTEHALAMWHHLWREALQDRIFMEWIGLEDTWDPARVWTKPVVLPIDVRPHADDGRWVVDEMVLHALEHKVDVPAGRLGLKWPEGRMRHLTEPEDVLRGRLEAMGVLLT